MLSLQSCVLGEVFELDGFVLEEVFGKSVHGVALLGIEEGVDEEGVEERAGGFNAVAVEDVKVELEVVPDLFGRLAEEGFEGGMVDAVVREVVGCAGFDGEGDAEDF